MFPSSSSLNVNIWIIYFIYVSKNQLSLGLGLLI